MGLTWFRKQLQRVLENSAAQSLCCYILFWITTFTVAGFELFPRELGGHSFTDVPLLAEREAPVGVTIGFIGSVVVWQTGELLRAWLILKNRLVCSLIFWIASMLLSAGFLADSGEPAIEELVSSIVSAVGAADWPSKAENLGTLLWLASFFWVIATSGAIFVPALSDSPRRASRFGGHWVRALALVQISGAVLPALAVRWHVRLPTGITPAETVPDAWELLSREELHAALVFVAVFSVLGTAVDIMSFVANNRAFLMVYSTLRFVAFPIIFYLLVGSWGPYVASGWARLTARLTNPAALVFVLAGGATCLVIWKHSQPNVYFQGNSRWVIALGIAASFAFWAALAAFGHRFCPKDSAYLKPNGVPYTLIGTFRSPWAIRPSPRPTAAQLEKGVPDPVKAACGDWPWVQRESPLLGRTRYCMLSEKWVLLSVNRGHARGQKLLAQLALVTRKNMSTFLTPNGCVKGFHFEALVVGAGAVFISALDSSVDKSRFPAWFSEEPLGAHFSRCVLRDLSPNHVWALLQCFQLSFSGPRWYLVELSSGTFRLIGTGYGEGRFVDRS